MTNRNPITGDVDLDGTMVHVCTAACITPHPGGGHSGPPTITVTDYDANGEAVDVAVQEAQPELPGMPPSPDIWPRLMGRKIITNTFKFTGSLDAETRQPYVRELAGRLDMEQPLVGRFHGYVDNLVPANPSLGAMDLVTKVKITWVEWGADDAYLGDALARIQAALNLIEDEAEALENMEVSAAAKAIWADALREINAVLNGDEAVPAAAEAVEQSLEASLAEALEP